LAAAALLLIGVPTLSSCGGERTGLEAVPVTTVPGPYDYDYLIPEGTAAAIERGEDPGVMPDGLDVRVGETIRIVNDDVESHEIGTFYVLAGTTLTYRFTTVGRFEGMCTTTPGATFILNVTE
jgi:hypothetical protein